MNLKKWIVILLVTSLITLSVIAAFNYVVDPFGVFGDKYFKMYGYDMTKNPRIAKIGYLDNYNGEYNSYIIGGSKCSSINPKVLNEYYGGDTSFYSMLMYGGDFYDYEQTLYYLVENYDVKNIVVHKSMHEISHYHEVKDEINNKMHSKVLKEPLLPFYFKFLTLNINYSTDKIGTILKQKYDTRSDVDFIFDQGVYDKSIRDKEILGTKEEFIKNHEEFQYDLAKMDSSGKEENLKSLERMKDYCDKNDVDFTFVVAPTYSGEMDRYDKEGVEDFLERASHIVGFWDFSGYNSISQDPRNFYDQMHYRNSVGEIMMDKMYGINKLESPEDFGVYRKNGEIIKK